MPIKPGERSLLAHIDAQPRVRSYLMRSIESGSTAQSFLFLGAPGVGKLDAAWAMAQAIVCEQGGCGACDDCIRAAHHTHPDIHYYAPESATGYLIAQTRALIDDVALAPIRSKSKVYILDHAEKLRAARERDVHSFGHYLRHDFADDRVALPMRAVPARCPRGRN